MKTIKLILICTFCALYVSAQNVPPFSIEEVEVVPPKFTSQKITLANSEASVDAYISKTFVYPEVIGIHHEGTEVVQFVISTNGVLSDFKIINSISSAIDEEIIRILETTNHMWIPGEKNGVPVSMEKEIAVQVKVFHAEPLNEERDFTSIAQQYFRKGAKKLLKQKKARQALRQFKNALVYRPYDQGLLTMLALCEMEIGHSESAHTYVSRIQEINEGKFRPELLTEDIRNSNSFKELEQLLANK